MQLLRTSSNPGVPLNKIRDSLVARITACRVVDRGSIPRRGECSFFFGISGLTYLRYVYRR